MSTSENTPETKKPLCKAPSPASPNTPSPPLRLRSQKDQPKDPIPPPPQQLPTPPKTPLPRIQTPIPKTWLSNNLSRDLLPYPLDSDSGTSKETPLRGCLKRSPGSRRGCGVRFVLPPTVFVVESFIYVDEGSGSEVSVCDSSDTSMREAIEDVVKKDCEEKVREKEMPKDGGDVPVAAAVAGP